MTSGNVQCATSNVQHNSCNTWECHNEWQCKICNSSPPSNLWVNECTQQLATATNMPRVGLEGAKVFHLILSANPVVLGHRLQTCNIKLVVKPVSLHMRRASFAESRQAARSLLSYTLIGAGVAEIWSIQLELEPLVRLFGHWSWWLNIAALSADPLAAASRSSHADIILRHTAV